MYRKEGPEDDIPFWTQMIFKVIGPCLSPGGAAQYVGVSRAAVHKRLKDGNLTGFFFYSTKARRSFFGGGKEKRELSVGYVPLDQCEIWRKEIERRAMEQGLVTAQELEDSKPEWADDFLEWDSKFAKEKLEGDK
jgi:hypothetical protein